MSAVAPESPPVEAFDLHESTALAESAVAADGTVTLHVIRPGEGRGRGEHYYSREMLRENAHKFAGWKMFVDHLAPEARKAAGGLPRSIRDLGGVIVESWWDESVPADGRHEQGAVVARARPIGVVKALIEEAPDIVEASISARATAVKPFQHKGKRVWAVEGIEDKGSVDWVSEAGAGGRVISLMESVYDDESEALYEALSTLSNAEFLAYIEEERPELLEAGGKGDDGEGDGESELAKRTKKLLPKFKGNKKMAEMAAKRELAAEESDEGGEVEITPELLSEALNTDEGREAIAAVVQDQAERLIEPLVEARVEEVLDEEREIITRQIKATSDRQILLRDLRDEAHRTIDEAKLPEKFAAQSKAKFDLSDGNPTPALNVLPEVNDDGEVTKTEQERLTEALDEEIKTQRELAASVNRTKVRGQGAGTAKLRESKGEKGEGEGDDDDPDPATKLPTLTSELLSESGFNEPDKVYETA